MENLPTTPVVSAVIVSRNCAADLRQCLSALDATIPRETLEIVVADNGSRDQSGSLDAEFPSAHFLRLPKNFGSTRALNIALRTAKGEYAFFLPPQAVVRPDTIQKLVSALEARPDAGAVCPKIDAAYALPDAATLAEFWKSGTLMGSRAIVPEGDEPVAVEFPKGAPILVRRLFVAGMNYFDERFGDFGPYLELCYQIRSAGKKILAVPGAELASLQPMVPSTETPYIADRVNGSAVYIGKHFGSGAGIGFRIKALLAALAGFRFGLAGALATGQKIDGTQGGA